LPDPVRHRFFVWIKNTSDTPLYFKIVCDIPNWELTHTPDVPADGKIGAVNAGATKYVIGAIRRSKPAGETEDTGRIKVEAYPDSAYTGLIESHSHPTTIYIEDLESWSNVQKWDFDDGTAQGWTLDHMSISDEKSIATPGYSARFYETQSAWSGAPHPFYLERSITLPNTTKVRLSFYFAASCHAGEQCYCNYFDVLVNGEILQSLVKHGGYSWSGLWHGHDADIGWSKVGVDLSDYRGQTVTIRINVRYYISCLGSSGYGKMFIDDIVVAGK